MCLKVLFLIPVVTFAFGVSVAPEVNSEGEPVRRSKAASIGLVTAEDSLSYVENVDEGKEEVLSVAEKMPEYPGGMGEMLKFLNNNIRYPEHALNYGVQGRVMVMFIVDRDGSITEPSVVKSTLTRPVSKSDSRKVRRAAKDGKVPVTAEQMDESAGRNVIPVAALYELVRTTPGMSVSVNGDVKVNGESIKKVVVDGKKYKVDKNQVAWQIARLMMEKESMRVVMSMPKWNPGMQKGKNVRVRFTLPITYKLK